MTVSWLFLKFFKIGDSTTSQQPMAMLSHPLTNKSFLWFIWNLLFQYLPIAFCPAQWTPLERVQFHHLYILPSDICKPWCNLPWACFPVDWTVPALSDFSFREGSPVPQPLLKLCWVSSSAYLPLSFVLGSPALDPALLRSPHQCSVVGKDHFSWP